VPGASRCSTISRFQIIRKIFAIGDCISKSWEGKPAPGIAPVAKQMGRYTAAVIRARVEGASPPPPFRYRHQGSLATIGRNKAIVDFAG
jgi:NADH dehydrogenase FAD-containing subunit